MRLNQNRQVWFLKVAILTDENRKITNQTAAGKFESLDLGRIHMGKISAETCSNSIA
jgi:hypothetical protein